MSEQPHMNRAIELDKEVTELRELLMWIGEKKIGKGWQQIFIHGSDTPAHLLPTLEASKHWPKKP